MALNRHIGDLGNIVADEDGSSTTKIKDLYTTLKPGAANSLSGRSVVIRAGEDDFETEGRTATPARSWRTVKYVR